VLGIVLAARSIPMVALLLLGGVVADRLSRSLVLQVSHLLSALTQGAVALLLLTALPMLVLGIDPEVVPLVLLSFAAGAGMEVFGIGWSTALQQQVPEEVLSRVFSYDALGSFVTIPVGQLLAGPLCSRRVSANRYRPSRREACGGAATGRAGCPPAGLRVGRRYRRRRGSGRGTPSRHRAARRWSPARSHRAARSSPPAT
jgi:MFS family permease